MRKIKVAPSILSGNFADMGAEVKNMTDIGADLIHVDVMDGVFVPNLTFGFKMIKDLRPLTKLPLDVHLMITEPIRYVDRFVGSGADIVTVHYETGTDVIADSLKKIRDCGAKCGLAVNPDTPIDSIKPYLDGLDLILVMTVFPGFGGQRFIDGSLDRIARAAELRDRYAPTALVEADGGINADNAADVAAAGCDILVAGNAVFGAKDRKAAVESIRRARK